jgi:hypothetical protein
VYVHRKVAPAMPTAAKFFAALILALTGAVAAVLVLPLADLARDANHVPVIVAAIGALSGWKVTGVRVGKGYFPSMASGILGALYLVFWALFTVSVMQMFHLAWRRHYDAPSQAVLDIVRLALEYGQLLLAPQSLGVLIVGGMASGACAFWAGRRWR